MRRIAGVVILVLGLVLAVLGILKILPGSAQIGIFGIFIGGVLIGLSFIREPEAAPDAPAPLSGAERVFGIFYEPGRVFQNLRVHPRWFAGFMAIAICAAIYHVAFTKRMTPEVIALAPIEKTIEGGFIPAERADLIREQTREAAKSPMIYVTGTLSETGVIFLLLCFLAAVFLVLALIFGGKLNFWQAMCISTYSLLPVIVIDKLLSLVLLYVKSPDDIDPLKGARGLVRADLGILFKPSEHPFLYVMAGSIGLLTLYGLWLEATGLRNTGEKISSGSAWTIVLLLWAIGLFFGLAGAALFPTFVS
jgi:Yip1 domain